MDHAICGTWRVERCVYVLCVLDVSVCLCVCLTASGEMCVCVCVCVCGRVVIVVGRTRGVVHR